MPKLLVFQHVAHEILGTLDPLLRSYGFRNRYCNFGRNAEAVPTIDGYHGLVVLGGPMNVDQTDAHPHLETEVRVIRQAVERNLPVLGICLGAQLLAKALGSAVTPNPEKEIGWYDVSVSDEGKRDPLFSHFDQSEKVFQWHGDTFAIPDGAVHLATSQACANQAFRYGERAYGLQFHLEVDSGMIERWLGVPVHRQEIESLEGRVCPDRIRADTARHAARLLELSDRCFTSFLELFAEAAEEGAPPPPLRKRGEHPHR
jgi:GMP synthase (glutamine-hydrolysing)